MTLHCAVSGWLLGAHSGANRRLLSLLREIGPQLARDERVTVLHRPEFDSQARGAGFEGIQWLPVNIPNSSTVRRTFAEQFQLPRILKQLGATVYDHGFLPVPRLNLPTCLTIHDLRAADGHSIWPTFLARSVLRKACRRADAIVTVSEWTKARIDASVPQAPPTTVVPNAVGLPDATERELPEPWQQPRHGYLLHVGHLEPRKNVALLVRALAQIDRRHAPELWLAGADAGAGPALGKLAKELGVTNLVRQLGPVSDDALHALYQNSRAVVMPSLYEGFGLPALEALAHGRPVLAADATALQEVLGTAATLLSPHDPEAWAKVMAAPCLDDATTRRHRVAAATRQTWDQSAKALLNIWRTLAP